jgi:hypothetical protein
MPQDSTTTSPLLRALFPDYWRLDSLVQAEVTELSDQVLNWTSDRWGWSEWSIKQQASHIASVPLGWLIGQWGDQIFGTDLPISDERYRALSSHKSDRRLDDSVFGDVESILGALDEVLAVCRDVLIDTTVDRARSMVVQRRMTDQWPLMRTVHPDGISLDPETGEMTGMDLVATFRHIQNEFYTHLFNAQRAKIALGIEPIVRLPDAGYHLAEGWDSDLPEFGAARGDID